MKKVIIFSTLLLACIILFAGCMICGNFVGWYGENPNHPKFKKDSIIVYVTLERHSKNIFIPGAIWVKNLSGYNLHFSVSDTYNHYLNVDSIVFDIYSADSKSILQSTIVEDNQFTIFYNRNYGIVEKMDKVYSVDELKSCKEDLLIDFTLYLQTKSNEQRMITYSCYKMEYSRGNGVYFYTAP